MVLGMGLEGEERKLVKAVCPFSNSENMVKKINYGESISPQSIQPLIKQPERVDNLIKWQNKELKKFKSSIDNEVINKFVKHYKNKIKKNLLKEKIFDNYFERMKFYRRMEERKLISVIERFEKEKEIINREIGELEKTRELVDIIRETWDRDSKKSIAKKQREKLHEFMVDSYKISCKHYSALTSFIYESFFIIEFNSKFLSGMGCYRFGKNIGTSKVMGHSDVWKTLKNLSGLQKQAICDHCFTKNSCKFGNTFLHLANLYASLIKLRMLSDYSEVFRFRADTENLATILSKSIIPTVKEVHKFQDIITNKSKIMWSPITDEDLKIF